MSLQFALPAAISAGANLLGGWLKSEADKDTLAWQQQQFAQQQKNWEQQFAFSQRQADFEREQFEYGKTWSREQMMRNEALQREFAQSGMQWRVEDAIKAGLHPLAALGAGGAAFSSPSFSIGGGGIVSPGGGNVGGFSGVSGSGLGSAVASMGQDISRAMMASATQGTRDAAFTETMRTMQLQNMALRNDLLTSQVQRLKQGTGPAGPQTPNEPVGTAVEAPLDPKVSKRNRLIMDNEEVIGHPGWSPTQTVSDEYGDENPVVQWIYGPLKMFMDWRYHNMTPGERMIAITPRRGSGRVGGPSGGGW